MKKFFIFLLVIVSLSSFSYCSKKNDFETEKKTEAIHSDINNFVNKLLQAIRDENVNFIISTLYKGEI